MGTTSCSMSDAGGFSAFGWHITDHVNEMHCRVKRVKKIAAVEED